MKVYPRLRNILGIPHTYTRATIYGSKNLLAANYLKDLKLGSSPVSPSESWYVLLSYGGWPLEGVVSPGPKQLYRFLISLTEPS